MWTRILRIGALPILLVAVFWLALLLGDVPISASTTTHILLFKLGLPVSHHTWTPVDETIIWSIRLPRVLAAALVGGALAVAGTLFQAILRNPLADPYVIGTAAGAQLGVIIAILVPVQIAFLGFGQVQALAFVGAVVTVLFVYRVGRVNERTPPVTLVLAGFVVSSFLVSATTLLMELSGKINQVLQFSFGSLSVSGLQQLAVSGPLIVCAMAVSFFLAPQLDIILLGEEQAIHLGVPVERLKLTVITVAALLTALAVALAGIIAFAGLVVPHALRLLYGPGHRVLIPASAVGGAVFLILADLIARTAIPPTEISLGVVTAVIGAPLFLHLLRRSRRDYAF